MYQNAFWKVCEALDNPIRIAMLRYLLEIEKTEFPCVNEIAEHFHLGASVVSQYLKKLSNAGLVLSKRAERRVYYRAFATTPEGNQVLAAFQDFFASSPNQKRMDDLSRYIHALSHERRNALVRCVHETSRLEVKELAKRVAMPYPTVDRLLGELDKARIVDLTTTVIAPPSYYQPESTLLSLTLA